MLGRDSEKYSLLDGRTSLFLLSFPSAWLISSSSPSSIKEFHLYIKGAVVDSFQDGSPRSFPLGVCVLFLTSSIWASSNDLLDQQSMLEVTFWNFHSLVIRTPVISTWVPLNLHAWGTRSRNQPPSSKKSKSHREARSRCCC